MFRSDGQPGHMPSKKDNRHGPATNRTGRLLSTRIAIRRCWRADTEAHQSKITAGHRRWRISLARRSAQRCTLGFTGAVTGEILAGAGFPDQVNYFPDVPL